MVLHLFQKLPYGLVLPCDIAISEANRGKNRYKDMYACKYYINLTFGTP